MADPIRTVMQSKIPLNYTDRFGLTPDWFDFLKCTFGPCGEQYTEKLVKKTVDGVKDVAIAAGTEVAQTGKECAACIAEEAIGTNAEEIAENVAEDVGVRGTAHAADAVGDVASEVVQDVGQRANGTPAQKVVIKKTAFRFCSVCRSGDLDYGRNPGCQMHG